MSTGDPLEGYRGHENLDEDLVELLVQAGGREFDAAKQLNDAQAINQFLKGAAGQLLLEKHDEAVTRLLMALTTNKCEDDEILRLCTNYTIQSHSFGLLLQTVREADELRNQIEQEQIDEQQATEPNDGGYLEI